LLVSNNAAKGSGRERPVGGNAYAYARVSALFVPVVFFPRR